MGSVPQSVSDPALRSALPSTDDGPLTGTALTTYCSFTMPKALTLEVLKQIRDEVRKTNAEIRRTNEEVHTTNERLDKLERRQTSTETRLPTELIAVITAVDRLREMLVG